jgi:hypothetical protein
MWIGFRENASAQRLARTWSTHLADLQEATQAELKPLIDMLAGLTDEPEAGVLTIYDPARRSW